MKNWKLTRIGKTYSFSAAHWITGVSDTHPCSVVHGHNYTIEVEVRGETNPRTGMVMDFHTIDGHFKPLIDQLDHTTLNDHEGLKNPTAENIAHWFLDRVTLKAFFSVKVWETDKCWAMAVQDGLFKKSHRE